MPRDFGYGSIVCVCNSTYCDLAAIHIPEKGYYQSYESDKSGNRFRPHTGRIDDIATIYNDVARIPLTLDPDVKYQAINGFGGAFTDSAGINIKRLSDNAQDKLIEWVDRGLEDRSWNSPNWSVPKSKLTWRPE